LRKYLLLIFFCFTTFAIFSSDHEKEIDWERVRSTWLSWCNEERASLGLHPYQYDMRLEKSAIVWSTISQERGEITHKRDLDDPEYYNYQAITKWFEGQGLIFKNIKGFTHTENIGWGYFKYRSGDYTQALIQAIRSTFDYYMSEKGLTDKWENAHYRSIIAPYFYYLGLGIVIDEADNSYYLTVHYGSEIVD
jgi:uncharacterized protein YkwD